MYELSPGRRTQLASALRHCRVPRRSIHDPSGRCRRLLGPASSSPSKGWAHRANTPRNLSPGSFPDRRAGGASFRVAVDRRNGRAFASNGAVATRPFRCAAGTNSSDSTADMATTAASRPERPRAPLRRCTGTRSIMERRSARDLGAIVVPGKSFTRRKYSPRFLITISSLPRTSSTTTPIFRFPAFATTHAEIAVDRFQRR